jgi:hypothetical protein
MPALSPLLGCAVSIRSFLIAAGLSLGLTCSRSATVPETIAQAHDVPFEVAYPSAPAGRKRPSPGAATSTHGPKLVHGVGWLLQFTAPTAMTLSSAAG